MSLAATVAAMTAAGCSAEQINAVVQAHFASEEERLAQRREGNRLRQQRKRERDALSSRSVTRDDALQGVTERDSPPPVSPKDIIKPPSSPLPASSLRSDAARGLGAKLLDGFNRFYDAYPKHTNRKAAQQKFVVAVKSGVEIERIVAAAERFAIATRRAQTEARYVPAPDVWLNKGRYDDEDLPEPTSRAGPEQRTDPWMRAAESLIEELNGTARQPPEPDAFAGPVLDLRPAGAGSPGPDRGANADAQIPLGEGW